SDENGLCVWIIIGVRIVALHEERGILKGREPDLAVKPMCVTRHQNPAPQSFEPRMPRDRLHYPAGQLTAAILSDDEHVCYVGERRIVADDAAKPDLLPPIVHAKRQRVINRAFDNGARDRLRPGRGLEKGVDERQIESSTVSADHEVPAAPFTAQELGHLQQGGPKEVFQLAIRESESR